MKSLLFVDDEPRVLQGLQRQLHGLRHEWQMTFVDGAVRALDHLQTAPVDVIVTDMIMPGMDGAQLLTEVSKRNPSTVRIVLSGHADRESVLRLVGPAHQYLSKPCDAEELRAAIHRAFSLRDLLASEPLKQLATRTCSLPTLPALHTQLTEELGKEDPSVERVSEIISKDIGMTSKILQVVNSAFFGLPQPLANPSEAVLYLGLATVRSLVLSLQVFSQYDQNQIRSFSIDALAQHSWMTAMWARRIAEVEHCDHKIDDQCFLAGLLHDIGQLIVASGLPEAYAGVLAKARSGGRTIWEVEQEQFGATHAEVGAYLLGLWGLPNPVIEAVALHHRPDQAAETAFSPVIAVHVANAFTHDRDGNHAEWPGNRIDLPVLARLGLDHRISLWRSRCFGDED